MGAGGYVAEFVRQIWAPLMGQILKKNIKVVTNAGGMNPLACKAAIEEVCRKAGVKMPRIAAVHGDDLDNRYKALEKDGLLKPFTFEGEVEAFPSSNKMIMSANAYIGAFPIAEALQNGTCPV